MIDEKEIKKQGAEVFFNRRLDEIRAIVRDDLNIWAAGTYTKLNEIEEALKTAREMYGVYQNNK